MSAQLEIELDLDLRAGASAKESHAIPLATNRRLTVQCPRDCFENGRLSRTVRSYDRRYPAIERHLRASVLSEVHHPESMDSHGDSLTDDAVAIASA
jgi:hypothetical protein